MLDATASKWARRRDSHTESTPPSSNASTAGHQEIVSLQPVACLSSSATSTVSFTPSRSDLTSKYRPELLISTASNRPFMSMPLLIPDGPIQQNCPISCPQSRERPITLTRGFRVRNLAPPPVTTTQATASSSASTATVTVLHKSSRITTPVYSDSTLSTPTSPEISARIWASDSEDKNSSVKTPFEERSSLSLCIRGRELVPGSVELLAKSQAITKGDAGEDTSQLSGLYSSPDLGYTAEKAFALSAPLSPPHSPPYSPPDLGNTSKRAIKPSELTLLDGSNTRRGPPSDRSNNTLPINFRIAVSMQSINDRGQRDSNTSRPNSTVNPYQNFVKQHDPDNVLDDGRSYVGRASHYVDKPVGPPSRINPLQSAPRQTPTPPVSRPAPSRELRQGDYKQSPQPAQRFTPGSKAPPKQPPGRYPDRDPTKSRWSGQSLATSSTLPPDFFSTAKPLATTTTLPPDFQRAESEMRVTSPSQVHASAASQRYITSNVQARRQTGSVMTHIHHAPNASAEGDPRPTQPSMAQSQPSMAQSQPGMDRRQGTSPPGSWQQRPPETNNAQARRQTGSVMTHIHHAPNASAEGDPRLTQPSMAQPQPSMAQSQPSMDRRQGTSPPGSWQQRPPETGRGDTSFTDRAESMGTRGYSEDEDERCGDGEDDGERTTVNTTSTSTSSPAIPREYRMPSHDSGRNNGPQILRTYPQDDQSLGDPLFLQYPIGDGCHMVVAMYVEKDAQSASRRFPNIARARLESSNRTKTPEEVAVIFREALEDEKKNVTG